MILPDALADQTGPIGEGVVLTAFDRTSSTRSTEALTLKCFAHHLALAPHPFLW